MFDARSNVIAKGILKAIFVLASLVLFYFLVMKLSSILWYFLLAFVISILGRPIAAFFNEKLKFSFSVSAILTIVLFSTIIAIIGLLMFPLISEQIRILSQFDSSSIEHFIDENLDLIESKFDFDLPSVRTLLMEKVSTVFGTDNVTKLINSIFGQASGLLIGLFSILFIAFFLLKERALMMNFFLGVTPDKNEEKVINSINSIRSLLERYFAGLLLQVTLMFIIYTILLLSFKIKYAIIIAMICAVFNLIPYLGQVFGFLTITLLSANYLFGQGLDLTEQVLPKATWIGIGFILAQFIDNFVNQPIIYAKSVKSHPLEIFVVIIAAGLLFDLRGMLLAIPGYTVIRVILKEFFSEFKVVKSLTKNLDS